MKTRRYTVLLEAPANVKLTLTTMPNYLARAAIKALEVTELKYHMTDAEKVEYILREMRPKK